MVVAYLEAVAGGESDRGWSLLLPGARRAYDSPEQYIELARGAAWDEFTWRLGEPESSYCEDGGVYCEVRLEIVGTPPGFLLEAPNSKPTDRLWTIALDQDEDATGDAWLIVYFNSEGPHGISTGGG